MITVYDANATRKELHDVQLVRPRHAGSRWQGIPHGELVDTMASEIEDRGWKILDQKYSLAGDGADLAGAFYLETPEVKAPEGQTLSLGFVTSNRMTKAYRLYVGSEIAICHNGMATGEMLLRKLHTSRLDYRQAFRESLDDYVVKARGLAEFEERLRERDLVDREWCEILVAAARQGYMSWSGLGKVDKEYREPRYEEHGYGTSWCGLQAFTEVVKQNPPMRQLRDINGFQKLLPKASRDLVTVA